MWITILFGLALMVLAVMLFVRNRAAWLARQPDRLDDTAKKFQTRQHRRRKHAAILIAVVGLAIVLSVWVPDPKSAAIYWLVVLLIAGWMAVLAAIDLIATRAHFGRLLQDQRDERAALEAELEQLKRHQGNGQPTERG